MFEFKSFDDLMGGCELFRESALRRGFLEADNSAAECIGRGGGMKSAFCGRTRGPRARAKAKESRVSKALGNNCALGALIPFWKGKFTFYHRPKIN